MTSEADLEQFMTESCARVDAHLDAFLPPASEPPALLHEAMRYATYSGGKRLRPALVFAAAHAVRLAPERAAPLASAVELVHAYSLVHDDLPAMDDDDLRRGRPTCHKRFDEATAILAGDALLTLAFEVLAESYPADTAAECVRVLAREAGRAGMVGGQADDLAGETGGGPRRLDELEFLHARKTGALIRASLRMGVWVAGRATAEMLKRFDEYGRCLGLAFQITDDLLDVEGTADNVGKRVQKDAGRGKLTYPGLLGVPDSRRRAERLCREACEVLSPLGSPAARLVELARYVVERDR